MKETSQKRALKNYRTRLSKRGMARFEVLALNTDRDMIRQLARKLAANDGEAQRLRQAVSRSIAGTSNSKGGILAWLRSSPLVGENLNLEREKTEGRKVDL